MNTIRTDDRRDLRNPDPSRGDGCVEPGDSDTGELLCRLRINAADRDGHRAALDQWALALTVLVLTGGGAVILSQARERELNVAEATAVAFSGQQSAAATVLQATGYVTAEREATVSTQIAGELAEVLIQDGEPVHQGQVLARLDDSAQRAALTQARAQLQSTRAILREDEVELAQARRDLARNEDLIGQHLIAEQTLEASQTQVAALAAQIQSQRRQVEVAQAGAHAAEVNVGYTVVRAPFSGVVVDKAAQTGEVISPMSAGGGFTRTGVATIVDMSSLEVDVDVNEAYLHRVHPGQAAMAVLDAYPAWEIPAHVLAIVPTADRSKATVKVRVALDREDPRILPDMGVRVSFLRKSPAAAMRLPIDAATRGTVLIPASTIVRREGRDVVFTIEAGRAHETAIVLVRRQAGQRQIQGIAPGVSLVSRPPAELRDGMRVKVKPE
ncbi:MAG TPA: efflux RND transporter periplasmic adaptor subunit [Steroidobacteraceae bacterium]|nr:efflux RND transporter periplasmic adaptor subunit [Steroidobacteraceae bacterium]